MKHRSDLRRVVLHDEGDQVCDALPFRLMCKPEFEILQAIVMPDAILVMNVFFKQERPAKLALNNKAMFEPSFATRLV
jgi:hypothetical protein